MTESSDIPTVYCPTKKACSDFGYNRFPNRREEGMTFLSGSQYEKYGSLRNQIGSEGNDKEAGNDVELEFIQNKPYTVTTEQQDGLNVSNYEYGDGQGPEKLIKYILAPNWTDEEGASFTHSHNWGSGGDFITKLVQGAISAINNIDAFINRVQNLEQGGGQARSDLRQNIMEQYIGSDRQTITIPFSLFTKNDFRQDIMGPIMGLTAMSYPQRTEQGLQDLKNFLSDTIQRGGVSEERANSIADTATDQNNINQLIPGFRVYASLPPALCNVRHKSGLFYFKNCFVENVKYEFLGPWISGNLNSSIDSYKAFSNPDNYHNYVEDVFPSQAKCEVTLKTTEPMFMDDFMAMINGVGGTSSKYAIRVEEQETVDTARGIQDGSLGDVNDTFRPPGTFDRNNLA